MSSKSVTTKRIFIAKAVALTLLSSAIPTNMQPARAALTSIAFESVQQNIVVLGDLASRSKNAQLSRSGASSPYTMSALSTSYRGAYDYPTDAPYGATSGTGHSGCQVNVYGTRGCLTQLRESDERANSSVTFSGNTTGTDTGKTGIIDLTQLGNVVGTPTGGRGSNQMANGEYSFASIFGPQIYSVPFEGSPGQAVTYQWKATGSGDDYEVYGFLVKISSATGTACTASSGAGTYGLTNPTTTHTILSYGRGKASNWTTTTGTISQSGCYRFRFVGGTYDASGGWYVGGTFRVYDVKLGLAQTLDFTQPADRIRAATNQTFTAQATSNAAGATLVFASDTTSICTVSGSTVTVLANQTGTCTLRVDSAAVGDYGAAPTTYTSFLVQAESSKPVSSGGDSVTGNAKVCSTLSVNEGSWSDGGETITATTYQWKRNGVAIIGATSSTYVVTADDVGAAISYDITKTNIKGSTTATSSSVIPVDARLSNLSISVGSLSPTFNSCTFSYSSSISTRQITITPTLSAGISSVTVDGNAVVSGQASGIITLSVGLNSIPIVVTNGAQTTTTTLSITYAQAPTVTILAPTGVTGTGATLNATVNANGQNTTNVRFEISTSATFTSDTATVSGSPNTATGTNDTNVTASSPTLQQQTTYYVRAFATNATGTTTSSSFTFTTPAAPFVTTSAAETLTATSVILKGSVVGNGDSGGTSTTVTFEYSLNSNMSSSTEVSPASNGTIPGGDTSTINVSRTITGLTTGQTYFFRLKATNNYGTNVGSILSFTLIGSPTVSTGSVSGLTSTSVTLNGTVNANSSPTSSIVFNWGTSVGSLPNNLSVTPSSVTGNTNTAVVGNLSGLSPNTTYYYRLSATNGVGNSLSTPVASFQTAADAVPTATLSAPSNSLLTQPFTVTVTFSEAVTGFASGDLQISGATSGWTAQIAQQISTSLYTVEFRPTSSPSAGNFQIVLPANTVLDSASQGNTASAQITVITSAAVIAPSISYPSYTISATQNSAITTLNPTNSGGIISSWSISSPPSLPSGLTFSTSSGQFSGTPTSTFSSTSFVVTATNSAGSDTKTVTISVAAPAPLPSPNISYSPSTINAVVGVAITTLTPTNSGETATSWSISPTLPSGLNFNSSTGSISGTTSSAFSTDTFTVTATAGNGTTGTATVTISSASAAATVPSAPTIGVATALSSTSATITFTASGSNGGSVILSYTATSSPGGITGTLTQSGSGTITVTGLSPATTYTFTVIATNALGPSLPSASSNTITTFDASALVSTFSNVIPRVDGFEVSITNFNSAFTYSVQVTSPARVSLSNSGFLTVTGLSGYGTLATVTVTTSRTGYTNGVSSVTGSTNSAPPPPNFLMALTSPTIARVDDAYICTSGTYEFIREARFKEQPKISSMLFRLFINEVLMSTNYVSLTSSIPSVGNGVIPSVATFSSASFDVSQRRDLLPAYCEILASQENATALSSSNVIAKQIPSLTWQSISPISEGTPLGPVQLNATANVPGIFSYSASSGTVLAPGKYLLTATFTPDDSSKYQSVSIRNELRVLPVTSTMRSVVSISGPQQVIPIRNTPLGSIQISPENKFGLTSDIPWPGTGLEKAVMQGSSLVVNVIPGFTGSTSIILIIRGSNSVTRVTQPLFVLPPSVTGISANIQSSNKVNLSWPEAVGANKYEVSIQEKILCSTAKSTCDIDMLIGPISKLKVKAFGKEGSASEAILSPNTSADFVADRIFFDVGEFAISNSVIDQILKTSATLKSLGFSKIEVVGHTDNTIGISNMELSRNRATAVAKVVSTYFDERDIQITAKADTSPISSNASSQGKAQNRRVEIRVVQ